MRRSSPIAIVIAFLALPVIVLSLAFVVLFRTNSPDKPEPKTDTDVVAIDVSQDVGKKQWTNTKWKDKGKNNQPDRDVEPEAQSRDHIAPPPREQALVRAEKWVESGFQPGGMDRIGIFYTYSKISLKSTIQQFPAFETKRKLELADVESLPELPFAFGLSVSHAIEPDALATLLKHDNLKLLNCRKDTLTADTLRVLSEARKLHLLNCCYAKEPLKNRPANDDEIVSFILECNNANGVPQNGDDSVKQLAGLKNLERLTLRDGKFTATGMKTLANFPKLQTLEIHLSELPDDAVREIARVVSLKNLTLTSRTLTDAGYKELATLPQLQTLYLHSARLTDVALKELAKILTLTSLNVHNCQITDVGLRELATLPELAFLSTNVSLSEETSTQLVKLPKLEHIAAPVTATTFRVFHEAKRLHKLGEIGHPHNGSIPKPKNDDEITYLSFAGSDLTDDDCKRISTLTNLNTLTIHNTKITATGIKELLGLKKLTYLALPPQAITDESLALIRGASLLHALPQFHTYGDGFTPNITWVKSVNLKETAVTDAGVKELAGCVKLNSLALSPKQFTDASIKTLREANQLHALIQAKRTKTSVHERPANADDVQYLDLSGVSITDAALKEFVWLKSLTTLNLSRTQVTDEGCKQFPRMRKLAELTLAETAIGDEGVKQLAALKTLVALDLSKTKVTDACLLQIVSLKELTTLNLSGTGITDDAVPELVEMQKLRLLDIRNTKISATGLKELRSRLRTCQILDK